MRPSLESVGDAYDDAIAESFFASLECELIDRKSCKTKTEAQLAVSTYIEGWYNPRRRHASLDYLSPTSHETRTGSNHQAANAGCPPAAWRAPRRRWTTPHPIPSKRLRTSAHTHPRNRGKSNFTS